MYRSQDRSYDHYRDSLLEIFNSFKTRGGTREDVVNLKDIELYFAKMKNEKKDLGCNIFENKIKRVPENRKIMNQGQFLKYFSEDVTKLSHFQDIFSAIDTDGSNYMSKKELKQLIRKFNLEFTERDVNLMMEVASSDGDKVSKQELANFLCQY